MNEWSKKTLELVTTKNYLDQLQIIYPHEEGERDISEETLNSIRHSFEKKDKKGFLNKLLGLERFPYKDSYIAFLRKDRTALERNPDTVKRIFSRLDAMGIDGVISGISQPKEANMRRGNQFVDYIKANFKSVGLDEFKKSTKGIVVLDASELEARDFCNKQLNSGISKRPDLVCKAGKHYVIGEAKFISALGGSQGRAFDDGIHLAINSSGSAYKVFILDGIIWIEKGSDHYKRIDHSTASIFSVLLLKEFLLNIE